MPWKQSLAEKDILVTSNESNGKKEPQTLNLSSLEEIVCPSVLVVGSFVIAVNIFFSFLF
jgi:hypothetical protein